MHQVALLPIVPCTRPCAGMQQRGIGLYCHCLPAMVCQPSGDFFWGADRAKLLIKQDVGLQVFCNGQVLAANGQINTAVPINRTTACDKVNGGH